MADNEKRRYTRDDRFAGKPLEAIVEDGNGFNAISGAALVNHSDGGMQIVADLSPNLTVGKVVIVFINEESSSKRKRLETVIVWISENDGRVKFGCEFTYPLRGVHLYL